MNISNQIARGETEGRHDYKRQYVPTILAFHPDALWARHAFLPQHQQNMISCFFQSYSFSLRGFQTSVEGNSRLLWFCFTSLCDWLAKLAPLPQPIRIKSKINRAFSHSFSRSERRFHVFASNPDWFITLFTHAVIGHSNYFGFGFTTLK